MREKVSTSLWTLFIGCFGLVVEFLAADISNSGIITIIVLALFYGFLTWFLSRHTPLVWWLIAVLLCTPLVLMDILYTVQNRYVNTENLGRPKEIQGIPCQGLVKFQKNGHIERCRLSRDHMFSANILPAGTLVSFSKDGRLKVCWLARDAVISGQLFQKDTAVYFTPESAINFCFLPRDTMIQGHLCKGRGHDYMTAFYTDGTLKTAWLARDEEIQGVPCSACVFMSNRGTDFHEDGTLQSCYLAKNATIRGHSYTKGHKLVFDRSGDVVPESYLK